MVMSLQLSDDKFRRLLQNFLSDRQKPQALSITVYTVGWVPHSVKVKSSGSSVFLGGKYDLSNTGHDTENGLSKKPNSSKVQLCQGNVFLGLQKS